jgi:hypothetical protein
MAARHPIGAPDERTDSAIMTLEGLLVTLETAAFCIEKMETIDGQLDVFDARAAQRTIGEHVGRAYLAIARLEAGEATLY